MEDENYNIEYRCNVGCDNDRFGHVLKIFVPTYDFE
jgi:hypothetical protein